MSRNGQKKESRHLRTALKVSGYLIGPLLSQHLDPMKERQTELSKNQQVIPYMAGVSEKLKRIWKTPHICVLQTHNILRQRLVYPKDQTSKQSNVYAVQCNECSEFYIGETKHLLRKSKRPA